MPLPFCATVGDEAKRAPMMSVQGSMPALPSDPVAFGVFLPCPTETTCIGGSNRCATNPANCKRGPTTTIDTGLEACELASGQIHECKAGDTIHG